MSMNEKLLNGNDKDVTIQCSDGSVRAHKCFLRAASDALGCMIDHDMREKATGIIAFPDVTVQMVNVFLRVLYTGHANPGDWDGDDESSPPLKILLGVATLAKKYMVAGVLDIVIQALKSRLYSAKKHDEIHDFEAIFAKAIELSLDPVRLVALNLAKDFGKFKDMYDDNSMRPEVAFEMQAVWPMSLPKKRPRLS